MLRLRVTLLVVVVAPSCHKQQDPPPITEAWTDTFERADVGGDYFATDASAWTIREGMLRAQNAYNHPLWLRKKLPQDAIIELDVTSYSPAGDMKVEAWGDGEHHATDKGQYTSSGYIFVMGGWNNSKSILAKGNEHGRDIAERRLPRVEQGHTYHWKIVRKGTSLTWFVDDMNTPFLQWTDPSPYPLDGHAYFAFGDWESEVAFDNLKITPQ
jgi:hypothetical protein